MSTGQSRTIPVVVSLVSSPLVVSEIGLDDQVRLACGGDRDAAAVVARELRPRLLQEVSRVLGNLEHDADDVVDDLLVAMLQGRVRPRDGSGEAIETLLRVARVFARRYGRTQHLCNLQ